ncbi:MAG: hypothetical protein OMM_04661 [Candidatus Magnetoglobus multicellularis str. Araruama]|uniref:Uncharacterized protein n=1 Tax=Candidatus Magnetoglobus multicellularis str. Araruama TaxID=890399 RepID=A0A1V1P0E7_9BACT|nr:MAG: hypothetical protein OMM_04661 [Candidatus Magnetoglobus multicellularis str. Araruama]
MITVDPISTVILKIELLDKRTAENWIKHWETIEINGYIPIYLVCDGGTALAKAHEEHLPDLIKQLYTYHAVAHILGVIDKRLGKAACDAIEKEYASNVIIEGANCEESKIQRLIKRYEENQKKAQELIERYDSFHYLYISILKELELFDETGKLRDRQTAEENIETCLDLLETEMGYEKQVKKIRRFMGDLLNYFEVADVILEELLAKHPEISKEVLEAVCLAWDINFWGKIQRTLDIYIWANLIEKPIGKRCSKKRKTTFLIDADVYHKRIELLRHLFYHPDTVPKEICFRRIGLKVLAF